MLQCGPTPLLQSFLCQACCWRVSRAASPQAVGPDFPVAWLAGPGATPAAGQVDCLVCSVAAPAGVVGGNSVAAPAGVVGGNSVAAPAGVVGVNSDQATRGENLGAAHLGGFMSDVSRK